MEVPEDPVTVPTTQTLRFRFLVSVGVAPATLGVRHPLVNLRVHFFPLFTLYVTSYLQCEVCPLLLL